jgi:outer membrane lipoprotein carrier protein
MVFSRIKMPILFFVWVLIPAGALYTLDDPGTILERVDDRYKGIKTLKAEFLQREKVATLGQTRESKGIVFFRKEGRMRWEYLQPEEQLMVADGKNLWMYYPDDETAYKLQFDEEVLTRTPLALLFREEARLSDYFEAVGSIPETEGRLRLELQPRQTVGEMSSVSLVLRPSDGTILGMMIKDAFGNTNEIELQRVVEGEAMDEGLFRFTPPPGTRIMEGGATVTP